MVRGGGIEYDAAYWSFGAEEMPLSDVIGWSIVLQVTTLLLRGRPATAHAL